jgi:hypothetical protein
MQTYSEENVLLRYNTDDRYGDGNNFEVCTTVEAKEALQNVNLLTFSFIPDRLKMHRSQTQSVANEVLKGRLPWEGTSRSTAYQC